MSKIVQEIEIYFSSALNSNLQGRAKVLFAQRLESGASLSANLKLDSVNLLLITRYGNCIPEEEAELYFLVPPTVELPSCDGVTIRMARSDSFYVNTISISWSGSTVTITSVSGFWNIVTLFAVT